MKKIFNRENILVLLTVGLMGHNIYLQTQIEEAINAANHAAYHAFNASDYASDASDYASAAADNASDAADYASDASNNAFGNNCRCCP